MDLVLTNQTRRLFIHVAGELSDGIKLSEDAFLVSANLELAGFFRELQGDHLSGKPENVRELYRCQGNVRNFTKSLGNVRELSGKNLVMENCPKTFIFASTSF